MGGTNDQERWWARLRFGRASSEAEFSWVDADSGIPARRWLSIQVNELEARSLNEQAPIAVLKLRVDDHGLATNEELVDVAGRLQSCLRAYERLFRLGDRDFTLLAPGADLPKARAIGRKLRDRVGSVRLWRAGSMQVLCGASASIDGEPFVFEWVSAKADQALEEAEHRGGVAAVESVQPQRLRIVTDESTGFPGRDAGRGGGDPSPPRPDRC